MAIVAIIVSVISASYYLKIIKVLHATAPAPGCGNPSHTITGRAGVATAAVGCGNPGEDSHPGYPHLRTNLSKGDLDGISNFHSFLISTLTLSILLFVLKPSILLNSTQLLSLSLFYY